MRIAFRYKKHTNVLYNIFLSPPSRHRGAVAQHQQAEQQQQLLAHNHSDSVVKPVRYSGSANCPSTSLDIWYVMTPSPPRYCQHHLSHAPQ